MFGVRGERSSRAGTTAGGGAFALQERRYGAAVSLRRTLHGVVLAVHAMGATLVVLQTMMRSYGEGSDGLAFEVALTIVTGACLGAGCYAMLVLGSRLRSPRPRERWLWSAVAWPVLGVLGTLTPASVSESMSIDTQPSTEWIYFLPSPLTRSVAMTLLLVPMMIVVLLATHCHARACARGAS